MISSAVWHKPRVAAKIIDDELEAATRFNGSDSEADVDAEAAMASSGMAEIKVPIYNKNVKLLS